MPIREKYQRLLNGESPRVLDLFAGCGGISLGFHSAGYSINAAIEFDPAAAASHALNFFPRSDDVASSCHSQARDITKTEPEPFMIEMGSSRPEHAIDVIVGGPPCQAFARVGRAKLREVAEHPHAFIQDPRSNLYLRYLHFVKKLKPVALLMENVPDVLNFGGHNIAEEMCEVLESLGYVCGYTLLNAVHYGVPQMRERTFLIAYSNIIADTVSFPDPTHAHNLPRGYEGTRQVALQNIQIKQAGLMKFADKDSTHFLPTPEPISDLPPAVTAQDALGDLPPITLHLEGLLKKGPRRFDTLIRYDESRTVTDYAMMMRTWPGFESSDGIYDHVIRYLPRDYPIFARMDAGNQYPEAHEHAKQLFREKLDALAANGEKPAEGTEEYEKLWKETVPPYDPGKFPNKWRKMEAEMPARTLMAHLGKDSYSHIHYDSKQARTISVREAARLQSFPDGFVFQGPMNPGFRQIGNAVPPLMARALAQHIMQTLRG
jgi:DNA (cytosine-5)-methyltransferase 1